VISTEVERAKSYWHFDLPGEMSIPVARPRLPTTDKIAPYLRRIDASRWYSNGGPLVQEFEHDSCSILAMEAHALPPWPPALARI
jgi:hypothetical protein